MRLHISCVAAVAISVLLPTAARAQVPGATTTAATSITTSSAVLNGTGTPNGQDSSGWFRYDTTNPGTCNDTFGTRVPSTSGTDLGTGSIAIPYSITTTGLTPGTTYYFCAIVSNASGTSFGAVLSFTVPGPPAVTTDAATSLTSTTATLNGSANPAASTTTGWFRYDTTPPGMCSDSFGTRTPTSGGTSLGAGTTAIAYSAAIAGLAPAVTYYFCAIASNANGTSFGDVLTFTAPAAAPTVTTDAATLLTGTTATLNGAASPGGDTATGWFRYATTSPGACNDTFGTRTPATGGSALGSGLSAVAYSQAITGLTAGVTYYFCAIASSAVSTDFGAVVSFLTPLPPTATTTAATALTNSSATINGQGTPNGASTTGWLRYATTNPTTCNDTFGSRVPATGGSALGAGYSAVAFAQAISGLSAGTTYYFCAIDSSSEGTGFGAVLTFSTQAVPTVTTSAATSVVSGSATLNGAANPNEAATTGWYRYATTSPGTCNDTFGTRTPTSGGSSLGSGLTAVAYSASIGGLSPGTTYYFCAIASNTYGTSVGSVLSFTTPAAAPIVTTTGATLVTGTTATLNGSANPGGDTTTGWFRYATTSPGSCNDTFGTRSPASGGSPLGSGVSAVAYSQGLTGLTAGVTYYYCAIAQNPEGEAFGAVVAFLTPLPPTVTSTAATALTNSSATINGQGTPNGASTTGWLRYDTTNPTSCNDTFGSRVPATGGSALGTGYSAVPFAQAISGLSAGTTYYFCAIDSSSEGTAFGAVLTFTTQAVPTVTTSAATSVVSGSATLNGAANPNEAATTGWYRYATTSPGTCNDTFGTRTPTSGGTSLGSGVTAVAYTASIAGLSPGTTYYFCAIASNTYGTSVGAVLSFTTPAAAPVVSSTGATLLTGTTATLNGSANPGGASTSGWFRYATTSPGTCNDTFGTRTAPANDVALGSGLAAVAYSEGITGLTAGTTYYYCAIASNSVATGFGAVLSFLTPLPPTVTSTAATALTNSSATINGQGTPNGASTTGWLRYDTTNPTSCNDTFGSRVPATGGSALGTGYSAVPFAQAISGLSAGTTYYFCAIDSSSEGTAFGAVLTFTTQAVPTVTTSAATSVVSGSATLNGAANPNEAATTGWYRYATTSPGTCNDTFGTRTPTSGGTSLGSGVTAVAYTASIAGLNPGTTYYFCAIASNTYGTSVGAVLSFTTPAAAPVVSSTGATLLAGTTATLNGSANPGGASTTGWFRYATSSPGSCNDTFGTRTAPASDVALGSGVAAVAYSEGVTGLTAGTTYYYCAIASNPVATGFGAVLSFLTPLPPTVTTTAATALTNSSATINGQGTPNGASTTGWLRYDTTNPTTCNDTFGSRVPATGGSALGAGYSAVPFAQAISGLSAGTTYYFCAIDSSSEGTAFGTVLTFTTLSPPTVTTLAATALLSGSATLNGSANPNGASATGWYRYATTSPGTCNDAFGTRTPTSGGTSLGSGNTAATYSASIAGLSPGTTYYFCAIASNSYGTAFGSVLSFTTPAAAPVVTTTGATLLTGTTATLNGSANPGGATTTGWFRYATTSPGTCNDTFGTRTASANDVALGSGVVAVAYSEGVTGLTAGTTYYYCAIASNSVAVGFGAVASFLTPLPPTVTTNAATSLTNTSATINGQGTPNGASTTGWLRYDTTNPTTCNDTFGSRVPATGGSGLGTGYSGVAFAQAISGLSSNTTYYFCAIDSSSEGTAFGAVVSFTTLSAPTVTSSPATAVLSTSATLNGSANPNGATATGWYRYASTSPGTCSDAFGTRTPTSGGSSLGAGTTAAAYTAAIAGLLPGTTYYFCAIASNAYGTSFGALLSFTTPAAAPTVSTTGVSALTGTTATLNGSADPEGATTTGWFRYATTSPGSCNDSFGTRTASAADVALGSGDSAVAYGEGIAGLIPGTTYYYCAIAGNSVAEGFGAVLSFATPLPPTVATFAATPVTSSSATLNAQANPNGYATTGWFRYSAASPGTCDDVFGSRIPASGGVALGSGTTAATYSEAIGGLLPGTTYYFCALASSAFGTSVGSVLSFTTPATQPSTTTLSASAIASTSATLNGAVNPNGADATGWFRYDTTNPGTCNDTFGTRTPATGGTDLGPGTGTIPYSANLTGLTNGATYYFCALSSNSVGSNVGAVLSFNTAAPTVTTLAASSVSSTAATLNGTANPNLSAATGWFRYDVTDPGVCNDSFGTRTPATSGTSLGAGSSAVSYTANLTGLTSGTTYYACAIASSVSGTGFGAVISFSTPGAPLVVTAAATAVSATGATLEGSTNPNLADATGWFRYALTSPGTCNDSFGTRTPASGGTDLGAGSTAVPYTDAVTGLASSVTYYYCAISSNADGTSFGAVLSFTTLAAPGVTTVAASSITSTTATLNGLVDPNLADATGWFRYDLTNPGACDDSFGTRTPATDGGTDLGAGSTAVTYSAGLTGLTSGATYYFCAIASNADGTSFGAVLSFSTPAIPVVVTQAVSSASSTAVTLNGSANPGSADTTGWFRYDVTNPGSCDDSFGTRAPTTGGVDVGAGSVPVAYSEAISGLTGSTTYYYCAIASNSLGTAFGSVLSFTTASLPQMTTVAATAIDGADATLNGSGLPNYADTTGWYRYDVTNPGSCDDSFGTRVPASGGTDLGAGAAAVDYTQALSGLAAATTYYFCAIGSNAVGTSFGAVLSFTTLATPTVATVDASAITSSSATLNSSVNPNLADTTGWFRYDVSNPGSCDDSFGTRVPSSGGTDLGAGSAAVSDALLVSGLTPGTTYYFCALASNAVGTSFGAVLSFETPAAPAVFTQASSSVTTTGATLNGAANPGGETSTGWFRYDVSNPGTCNDTFGTRTPASGGTALGQGTSAVAYLQAITGLTQGTTYYFCAIASNSLGTGLGGVLSFTTASPPLVITDAASPIQGTSATLNSQVNPGSASTTTWFRYDVTNPGACNDSFGVRSPASGGTVLNPGSTAVANAQSVSGLTSATTYYFCAIAANANGTAFGAVLSFGTAVVLPPLVTTDPATGITGGAATLDGTATPNLNDTTAWFRYDTAPPTACDDAFGTRVPADGGTDVGSGGSPVPFSDAVPVSPGTTYYYCAIASSTAGTAFGAVLTVTGAPIPPSVTTDPATNVTNDSATLNGSVDPNDDGSVAWFRYDVTNPGTCSDNFGTRLPMSTSSGIAIDGGTDLVAFSESLTGLSPGTTYYYCAIATNPEGLSVGEVVSFSPGAIAPTVTTGMVASIGTSIATLGGSANPNASDTSGWFRYSLTSPGTCNDSFGTRAPAMGGIDVGEGTADAPFFEPIAGLTTNTTYYYCALASNLGGAAQGQVLTFVTAALPPSVETISAVTEVGSYTFDGSANPEGSSATGWFRYSQTLPSGCNDSFGTRAPATGGRPLGSGMSSVAFTETVSNLSAGTYYVCAIASNSVGTSFGNVTTLSVSASAAASSAASGCHCWSSGDGALTLTPLFLLVCLRGQRRRRRC